MGGAAGSSRRLPSVPARSIEHRPPLTPGYSEQLKKLRREELTRELFEAVCSVKEHVSASPSKQAALQQQA